MDRPRRALGRLGDRFALLVRLTRYPLRLVLEQPVGPAWAHRVAQLAQVAHRVHFSTPWLRLLVVARRPHFAAQAVCQLPPAAVERAHRLVHLLRLVGLAWVPVDGLPPLLLVTVEKLYVEI